MSLRIYNTLTGEKEIFEPIVPGKVGIYLCGPTVYKPAHLGHAVGPIIFDAIKRYLTFKGYRVTWVVNVTDVEDKLMAEAARLGTSVPKLARELEQKYVESMHALGVRTIDHMPRASEHIPEIITQIQQLIAKGHAYAVEGDVYFDVTRDSDYGKLSNRKPEEQFAGTREGLVQGNKRNPGDFAVWKAAKPEEPDDVKYDSPWGKGRPGWHIECSAMSMKLLGETFDIHGGGLDLKFPHHENEIGQAECATGKPFCKIWMHHGLTRFNTKKISKSDPEFEKVMSSLQLSNLLKAHPPELLRFLIVQSHYRSPIDFSDDALQAAKTGISTFYRLFERLERTTGADPYTATDGVEKLSDQPTNPAIAAVRDSILNSRLRFLEAMDDDFNTAGAIGVLFDIAGQINKFLDAARLETKPDEPARITAQAAGASLITLGRLLGLFLEKQAKPALADDGRTGKLVELLIDVRKMARTAKQFAISDHIRDNLGTIGIVLEDSQDGTRWRVE
ncbi:MAG: cysteine--tRNA ligase [Planctomycetes bacterium]|nr:cysteine--tRNA ligase [Planctomycetota bacterium]